MQLGGSEICLPQEKMRFFCIRGPVGAWFDYTFGGHVKRGHITPGRYAAALRVREHSPRRRDVAALDD